MSNLVQSIEVLESASAPEDTLARELKDTLASLAVGSGVRAKLVPGTEIRVKRLTRRLNRILSPSRYTARVRGEVLYVERIG